MSLRSRGALAGALAGALLVPLSALDAAAGEPGQQHARSTRPGPSMLTLDARGSTRPAAAQRATTSSGFVGSDGLFYDWAPLVVGGFADDLFLGQDFDAACADGRRFAKAVKRLAKLARLIESAGKRVVFTVAPNKSSVNVADVDWANVPHGSCGQFGVTGQNATLDSFKDARYLPIRKSLADDPREVYWKTDAHWTTVGSSVYASELASKLSKKLGRRQKYAPTTRTELGDIYQLLGLTDPETAPALLPADGVTVTTAPGSDGFDAVNAVSFQHSWLSAPASRTLGGHTLLIGDSFTYLGLEALRPLFAKGTFMWIQPNMLGPMAAGIAGADTVVIEVVQRFVSTSILATTTFRAAVKELLRRS